MSPTLRLRLWGAVGLAVMIAGVGALLQGALASSAREQVLREQQLAQGVFDAVERELAWIVDQEESRPFLHWSYHFVPDNDLNTASLARSPLATLPSAPLLGYFQLRPDGTLETPYQPRTGATTNPLHDVEGVVAQLAQLAEPLKRPMMLAVSRSTRAPQIQQAQRKQVGNFAHNASPEDFFRDNGVQVLPSPPVRGAEGEIAVTVEPFELVEVGPALLLHRTVSVAGEQWVQGLAWDRAGFLAQVSSVEGAGAVDWSGTTHSFPAPFEALSASVVVPAVGGGAQAYLWSLALLTIGILGIGGWMADRWMNATLEFARQRTDFVAAVSHELRTPLTSIRMYADMLEQGMVSPDQRGEYYATIRTESERLARLVEDVLAFSRLDRVGEGGPPGTVGEAAAEMERMLGPVAAAADASLRVDVAVVSSAPVRDRDALVQVLTNLVDNALKFSAESAQKQVLLSATCTERGVEIVVSDRGPGVAPAFIGRMFEPFVRGEPEGTRRTTGTGIGLALVAGLVQRLGGEVGAFNRPGGGLEVRVSLPDCGSDLAS